jgi:very-short-patch-repair endonuclease
LKFVHNLELENYIVQYEIENKEKPKCFCGCGENVKWKQCGFHDYLSGHFTKTKEFDNPWFKNKGKSPKNKIVFSEQDREMITNEFVNNHRTLGELVKMFNNKFSRRPICRVLIEKLGESEYYKIASINDSWRRKNIPEMNEHVRNAASLGGQAFSKKFNTKIEKMMKKILNDLNIRDKFSFQFRLKDYISKNVFCFDFGDKNKKILIECDGDYWHANPLIYKELNNVQIYNVERDKTKNEIAEKNGYKLIRFWENEIKNDTENVKEKIKQIYFGG